MTKQVLIDSILSGQAFIVVEFRASKTETIKYRDPKTQQAAQFTKLTHNVEMAGSPVIVSERIPDGVDPNTIKSPFSKGQMVVLHLQRLTTEKGVTIAQGQLHSLELKA